MTIGVHVVCFVLFCFMVHSFSFVQTDLCCPLPPTWTEFTLHLFFNFKSVSNEDVCQMCAGQVAAKSTGSKCVFVLPMTFSRGGVRLAAATARS